MNNVNKILSEKPDKELVELLIGGSQEAFEKLYINYRKPLMYSCKRYMKSEAESEDIVHDVFLQIWETRHLLNPELSFAGYVQKLVHNSILYMFRKSDIHSRFVQHIIMNTKDLDNETENSIVYNDYLKLLDKMIESLPPKQKEIFQLNHIDGLTYKEISELLQIPVENVRKNISLALKKLKKHINKHANADVHAVIVVLVLLELLHDFLNF